MTDDAAEQAPAVFFEAWRHVRLLFQSMAMVAVAAAALVEGAAVATSRPDDFNRFAPFGLNLAETSGGCSEVPRAGR